MIHAPLACKKCQTVKTPEDFYPYQPGECKECTRTRVKANRHGNAEYYRAYDRERSKTPKRREHIANMVRKFIERSPERRRAQVLLGNAVRNGRVTPWPACALPDCNAKPEAHHPDYSQPLQVVWLCPAHHKQTHAMAREVTA